MTVERTLTEDKVIETVTTVTEYDRIVDFNDILDSVEIQDDDIQEAPWEACDGWEHEHRYYIPGCYHNHEDVVNARGYANMSQRRYVFITIDDDTITGLWGCNGYSGASKQVRAELIAQAKRNALDQLVDWYENGWSWYYVYGEYNGYTDSVGGIDDYECAVEMIKAVAIEIAAQMTCDGYIIENLPEHETFTEKDRYVARKQHERHIVEHRGGHTKRHRRHLANRIERLTSAIC